MISIVTELIALAAFTSAAVFGTAGIIGLYRFPDPYARMQASSLCGTTAVFSVFLGSLALAPSWAVATRLVVLMAFFLVSGPTGGHIVARFAWNSGIDPWRPVSPVIRPARRRFGGGKVERAKDSPLPPESGID
ncbi:MAG: cation:proton antiporter [Spirochaetales bacterium]|nr:MAG: cation:proton antiporter [Spirochaetales bacterium]